MNTKYNPMYWNGKGKYQQEYENLHNKLIPYEGEAETVAGEILRITSNVYYDHFNNGGNNLNTSLWSQCRKLVSLAPDTLRSDAELFTDSCLCYSYDDEEFNEEGAKFADKFVDKIIEYLLDIL